MNLQAIELSTSDAPRASLIILHGLGADGSDFVPVCQALQLDAVGGVRCILPSAPVMPVSINGGYEMRAWYDIYPVTGPKREDETTLRHSQQLVEGLIEREVARGIPANRIVLMGFSQGCAMTLMTGLRHPARLAGLAALSGYLPLAEQTAAERHSANADVPIFMAHGVHDDVVVLDRAEASRDLLQQLGYAIDWHTYPIAHSVSLEEIQDLNAWLLKVLA